MVKFLDLDIARLVLGYLQEENLRGSARKFVQESPHLTAFRGDPDVPALLPNAKGLVDILDEYAAFSTQVWRKGNQKPKVGELWRKLDGIIGQLKYENMCFGEDVDLGSSKKGNTSNLRRAKRSLSNLRRNQVERQKSLEINTSLASNSQDFEDVQSISSLASLDDRADSLPSPNLSTPRKDNFPKAVMSTPVPLTKFSPKRKSSLPKRKLSPDEQIDLTTPNQNVLSMIQFEEIPDIAQRLMQDPNFIENLAGDINKVLTRGTESTSINFPTTTERETHLERSDNPATASSQSTSSALMSSNDAINVPSTSKQSPSEPGSSQPLSEKFMEEMVSEKLPELFQCVRSQPAYDNLFAMFKLEREEFMQREKQQAMQKKRTQSGDDAPIVAVDLDFQQENDQDEVDDNRSTPNSSVTECDTPESTKGCRASKQGVQAPTRRSGRIKDKIERTKTVSHQKSKMSAEDKEKMNKYNEIAKQVLKKGKNPRKNSGKGRNNPKPEHQSPGHVLTLNLVGDRSQVKVPVIYGSPPVGQVPFVPHADLGSNVIHFPQHPSIMSDGTVNVSQGYSTMQVLPASMKVSVPLSGASDLTNLNSSMELSQSSNEQQGVWTYSIPNQQGPFIIQSDGTTNQYLTSAVQPGPNSAAQISVGASDSGLPRIVQYQQAVIPSHYFGSYQHTASESPIPSDQDFSYHDQVEMVPCERGEMVSCDRGVGVHPDGVGSTNLRMTHNHEENSKQVKNFKSSLKTGPKFNQESISSVPTESFTALVQKEEQRIQQSISINENIPDQMAVTPSKQVTSFHEDLSTHLDGADTRDIDFAIQHLQFTPPSKKTNDKQNDPSPIAKFMASAFRKCVMDSVKARQEKEGLGGIKTSEMSPWKKTAHMLTPEKNKCVRKVRFDVSDEDFIHPENALGLTKETIKHMEREVQDMGILKKKMPEGSKVSNQAGSKDNGLKGGASKQGFVEINTTTAKAQSRVKVGEMRTSAHEAKVADGEKSKETDRNVEVPKSSSNSGKILKSTSPRQPRSNKKHDAVSKCMPIADAEKLKKLEKRFSGVSRVQVKAPETSVDSKSKENERKKEEIKGEGQTASFNSFNRPEIVEHFQNIPDKRTEAPSTAEAAVILNDNVEKSSQNWSSKLGSHDPRLDHVLEINHSNEKKKTDVEKGVGTEINKTSLRGNTTKESNICLLQASGDLESKSVEGNISPLKPQVRDAHPKESSKSTDPEGANSAIESSSGSVNNVTLENLETLENTRTMRDHARDICEDLSNEQSHSGITSVKETIKQTLHFAEDVKDNSSLQKFKSVTSSVGDNLDSSTVLVYISPIRKNNGTPQSNPQPANGNFSEENLEQIENTHHQRPTGESVSEDKSRNGSCPSQTNKNSSDLPRNVNSKLPCTTESSSTSILESDSASLCVTASTVVVSVERDPSSSSQERQPSPHMTSAVSPQSNFTDKEEPNYSIYHSSPFDEEKIFDKQVLRLTSPPSFCPKDIHTLPEMDISVNSERTPKDGNISLEEQELEMACQSISGDGSPSFKNSAHKGVSVQTVEMSRVRKGDLLSHQDTQSPKEGLPLNYQFYSNLQTKPSKATRNLVEKKMSSKSLNQKSYKTQGVVQNSETMPEDSLAKSRVLIQISETEEERKPQNSKTTSSKSPCKSKECLLSYEKNGAERTENVTKSPYFRQNTSSGVLSSIDEVRVHCNQKMDTGFQRDMTKSAHEDESSVYQSLEVRIPLQNVDQRLTQPLQHQRDAEWSSKKKKNRIGRDSSDKRDKRSRGKEVLTSRRLSNGLEDKFDECNPEVSHEETHRSQSTLSDSQEIINRQTSVKNTYSEGLEKRNTAPLENYPKRVENASVNPEGVVEGNTEITFVQGSNTDRSNAQGGSIVLSGDVAPNSKTKDTKNTQERKAIKLKHRWLEGSKGGAFKEGTDCLGDIATADNMDLVCNGHFEDSNDTTQKRRKRKHEDSSGHKKSKKHRRVSSFKNLDVDAFLSKLYPTEKSS